MTTIYLETIHAPDLPYALVFWPNLRFPIKDSRLFLRGIMEQYPEPFFSLVGTREEAEFYAVPFEYCFVREHAKEYLERVLAQARRDGKKVLLFDYSDYVDTQHTLPAHAILFRVSAYRHHRRSNEIIMPYFVKDFGDLPLHSSLPARPIVGFCGLAQYGTVPRALRAWVRRITIRCVLALRGDPYPRVHAKGIYWRRRTLRVLKKCTKVEPRFIERTFYSLHEHSVKGDPVRIREEYEHNLRESHLALSVRGDANASQRFYEALSAGRPPLFLDTDCVLPLEECVQYEDALVRVPWRELSEIGEKGGKWFSDKTPAAYGDIARNGKEIFQKYLRMDRFFSIVFDREKSPYTKLLYD